MADVFISYAREDRKSAEKIASALETERLSIWWDRELIGGDNFDDAIERELGLAKCIVVLWSQHSIGSNWVRNEASMAAERDALVPVFIENVKLPLEFRRKHTIDLTMWMGDSTAPEFIPVRRAVAVHTQRNSTAILSKEPIIEKAALSTLRTPGETANSLKVPTQEIPAIKYVVLTAIIVVLFFMASLFFRSASVAIVGVAVTLIVAMLFVLTAMIARLKKTRVTFILFIGSTVLSCFFVFFVLRNPAATHFIFEPQPPLVTKGKVEEASTIKVGPRVTPQQEEAPLAAKEPSLPPPPKTAAISTTAESQPTIRKPSANLIHNGSFESIDSSGAPSNWEMESWDKNSGELQLDSGEHGSGARSVKLSSSSPNHLRWVQVVALRPRTTYLLSGWVKTEDVAHTSEPEDKGASFAVRWSGTTSLRFLVSGGVFGTSHGWQLLRFYFETEENSLVTIMLQLGSYSGTTSGVAWFDDVNLELVSPE
jgi:hypothetical protein